LKENKAIRWQKEIDITPVALPGTSTIEFLNYTCSTFRMSNRNAENSDTNKLYKVPLRYFLILLF